MNKKYLKKFIFIISTLLIIIVGTLKTYAINSQEVEFAEISSNTASVGETLQITLDLNKIEYSKYKVLLTSNQEIEEISLKKENEELEEIVENNPVIEEVDSNKSFEISNIENMETLTINYQIPETAQIGDKIKINITIINLEENMQIEDNNKENVVNEEIDNNNTEQITTEFIINIIEKTNKEDNELNKEDKEQINEQSNNKQTTSSSKTQTTTISRTVNTNNETSQSTTYNGSSDNYLTSISVEEEYIQNFNKTNTTYFVTVQEKDELNISCEKSNSNSTTCIYGNTNLQKGLNKILITVTAENGNVKNYRLYVTVI